MPSIADVVIRTRLEGDALDRLPAQLRRIPDRYTITVAGKDQASQPLKAISSAADRAGRDVRALAQEQIRTAVAARDFASAQQIVVRELQRSDNSLLQNQRLLTQQARLQRQAASAARETSGLGPTLPRSVEFFGKGAVAQIGAVATGLGGVATAMTAVNAAIGAGQSGLALRRTENSVKLLAQSTENYENIVRLAREQQVLFGGSLQQNIAQMGQLGGIAARTGVDLARLNDIAQRLVIKDPTANFGDAAVALSEAFAGDTTSLAERFELDRKALAGLREEGITAAQRAQILNDILNAQGIQAGAAATAIDETSRAYNSLGAAVGNVTTGSGADIADAFAPLARGLTTLLTSGEGVRAQLQQQASAAAALSGTYAEYQENIQRVIDANSGLVFSVTPLTEAQFQAAQALEATGVNAETAATKITALSDFAGNLEQWGNYNAVLEENSARILALAASSPEAAVSLQALAEQVVLNGDLSAGFVAQLEQMEAWLRANADAAAQAAFRAGEHSIAIQESSAATQEAIEKAVLEEAQTRLSTQAKDQLAASAQAAAQELLNSGNASLAARQAMAAQYGVAINLVDAYYQIAQAARAAAIAQAGAAAIAQNIYDDAGNVMAGRGSRKPPGAGGEVAARLKALREIEAAQQAAILSTGTYSQKLAALTKERDKFVKGSADWIKANTAITSLQQSQARSASSGSAASKDAAKAANEAERLQAARDALLSDEEKLAVLRQRVASGKLSELDRLEAMKEIKDLEERIAKARASADAETLAQAEKLKKAREDLLSDQELLNVRRAEVASGTLPEVERLEALKEIRDLEEKIADARARAEEAAVDAALGRVNDAQKRMEEERRIARANRVLNSRFATEEDKQAARLALQEVELERKKRALDIAENDREAGQVPTGTTAAAAGGATRSIGAPNIPQLKDGALPVTLVDPPSPAAIQPTAAPAAVAEVVSEGGESFAEALRGALDGATLLLQGSDGRLTPAVLQIAVGRAQVGKR